MKFDLTGFTGGKASGGILWTETTTGEDKTKSKPLDASSLTVAWVVGLLKPKQTEC